MNPDRLPPLSRSLCMGGPSMPANKTKRISSPAASMAEFQNFSREIEADYNEQVARARGQHLLEAADQRYAEFAAIIEKVTSDLIEILMAGHSIDVESTIQHFLESELEEQQQLKSFEKNATLDLRRIARFQPSALPFMNEMLRTILGRIEREAVTYRDARWRLMRARAQYMPSAGSGKIHGEHSDIDEYLKTIS